MDGEIGVLLLLFPPRAILYNVLKVAAFIASFVGYAALLGVSDHKYCMVDSGYL